MWSGIQSRSTAQTVLCDLCGSIIMKSDLFSSIQARPKVYPPEIIIQKLIHPLSLLYVPIKNIGPLAREKLRYLFDIFVTSSRETLTQRYESLRFGWRYRVCVTHNDDVRFLRHALCKLHSCPQGMRRFKRWGESNQYARFRISCQSFRHKHTWNNSFQLCAQPESAQRLLICRDDILRSPGVLEPSMLGSDAGIVKSCADRVCLDDLTFLGLKDIGAYTMQHTGRSFGERSTVIFSVQT